MPDVMLVDRRLLGRAGVGRPPMLAPETFAVAAAAMMLGTLAAVSPARLPLA